MLVVTIRLKEKTYMYSVMWHVCQTPTYTVTYLLHRLYYVIMFHTVILVYREIVS